MSDTPAPVHAWLSESIDDAVKRAIDRVSRADDVRHVAVMPDVHLAGDICVGMPIGTSRLIYPGAVGGDIGCGMLAHTRRQDFAFENRCWKCRSLQILNCIEKGIESRSGMQESLPVCEHPREDLLLDGLYFSSEPRQ